MEEATLSATKAIAQQTHADEIQKVQEELNIQLQEFHCSRCGHFLCLQAVLEGTIVIKCRRCKEVNVLDIHSLEIIEDAPLTAGGKVV